MSSGNSGKLLFKSGKPEKAGKRKDFEKRYIYRFAVPGLVAVGILLFAWFFGWKEGIPTAGSPQKGNCLSKWEYQGPTALFGTEDAESVRADGDYLKRKRQAEGDLHRNNGQYFEHIPADDRLLQKYKELNEDVVAVITIPDTILRHPVVQSPKKGEGFYLSHDLLGKPNSHGVPFLTLKSDIYKETGNNIIYGHNIIWTEPKDVFCDLVNYEDINYYREHPLIEIATNKGTARYIIFSYAIMDNSDSDAFEYWNTYDFEDDRTFAEYMGQMEMRNWLLTDVPYTRYDAFITISTCSREMAHSGTNRMVIMARRLKVGEDYERYIQNAAIKEDVYLPRKLRDK